MVKENKKPLFLSLSIYMSLAGKRKRANTHPALDILTKHKRRGGLKMQNTSAELNHCTESTSHVAKSTPKSTAQSNQLPAQANPSFFTVRVGTGMGQIHRYTSPWLVKAIMFTHLQLGKAHTWNRRGSQGGVLHCSPPRSRPLGDKKQAGKT